MGSVSIFKLQWHKGVFIILKVLLAFSLCLSTGEAYSQRNWKTKVNQGFFVENKGQFSDIDENPVHYVANLRGFDVYFLESSIQLVRADVNIKERRERKEKLERGETLEPVKYVSQKISFNGHSKEISISPKELQTHYFTYSYSANIKARVYKKLVYKNVYPNIDMVFYLPEKGGLKYDIVLHEGANPEDISLKYGNNEDLSVNSKGDLIIVSDFGTTTDQAPTAIDHTSQSDIKVNYLVSNNVVKFHIPDFVQGHAITIDPWINTMTNYPLLPAINIDYDYAGNTYVVGRQPTTNIFFGTEVDIIRKYSPTGVLLWSYSVAPQSASPAGFAVDRSSQFVYTHGGLPWGNLFKKIDQNGAAVDSIANNSPNLNPTSSTEENNRFEYDHCTDTIVIGAGFDVQVALVDTGLNSNNGFTLFTPSSQVDVQMMTMDPYERSAYVFFAETNGVVAPPIHNNALAKINLLNVSPYQWLASTGYNFPEYYTYVQGSTPGTSYQFENTFNGVAASIDQVYTYNGFILKSWDKTTGAALNTINVLSGAALADSAAGVTSDVCGNVYVGVKNSIRCYDKNLNFLSSYAISGVPYDLQLGDDNLLYACGDDFIEVIDIELAFPTVHPLFMVSATSDSCNLGIGTAMVTGCSYLDTLSVLWSNGQTTPNITGLTAGTYTVEVTVDSLRTCNGFSYTFIDSVVVQNITSPCNALNIDLDDDTICVGDCVDLTAVTFGSYLDPVTYQWDNGIASTDSLVNVCPGASTTYTVIATDANGEMDTASATVTVFPLPMVDLGPDTVLCGGTLTLNAQNPGSTYLWQDNSNNQTFTADSTGSFWVEVSNNGCTDADTVVVMVQDVQASFSASDTSGCAPLSVSVFTDLSSVSPGSISSWNWDFGDGNTSAQQNVGHTYTVPNSYDVSLSITTNEGCVDDTSITAYINVHPNPTANFSFEPTTVLVEDPNVSFVNLSQGAVSYLWDFGNGDTSTEEHPSYVYPGFPGEYLICLYVENEFGCTDSTCSTILVEEEFTLYVPNAFTPNGDGVNEIFSPVINGHDPSCYQLQIFDRWGHEIFQTKSDSEGWAGSDPKSPDGMFKEDIYVWKITACDHDSVEIKEFLGHVTLIK